MPVAFKKCEPVFLKVKSKASHSFYTSRLFSSFVTFYTAPDTMKTSKCLYKSNKNMTTVLENERKTKCSCTCKKKTKQCTKRTEMKNKNQGPGKFG